MNSTQRYVKQIPRAGQGKSAQAFVPLVFTPGDVIQFDWNYEQAVPAKPSNWPTFA